MIKFDVQNWIGMGMVLAALFVSSSRAVASDFYVSQNGAGITNSLAWLNTPAHWNNGAGTIQAGDTVHLVGTFTNNMFISGGGTAGNPVTVYFEPNAKFSAPTLWGTIVPNAPTYGWIYVSGDWVTIDGGSNGLIENTDTGSPPTYDYTNAVTAIKTANVSHLTVKNLRVRNMYVRNNIAEWGIGSGALNWLAGSDLVVSNCFFSEGESIVSGVFSTGVYSNLTVVNCVFSNFVWGIDVASGGAPSPFFYNATIKHNQFIMGDMFQSTNELYLHRDPMIFFVQSSDRLGCLSNLVIEGNYIKAGDNPAPNTTAGTGGIFFSTGTQEGFRRVRIFNNISTTATPLSYSGGGGMIAGVGDDVLVANNTAIGGISNGVSFWPAGNGISIVGTNAYAWNNICISDCGMDMNTFVDLTGLTNSDATNMLSASWSDYNVFNYQGNSSFQAAMQQIWTSAGHIILFADNFAKWTNILSGFSAHTDPHSTTELVKLNTSFQPMPDDTTAVNMGTNLTAFAIADGLPDLTNDYAGNPRPATGNWTIGAYQNTNSGTQLVVSPDWPGYQGSGGEGVTTFNGIPGPDITNGLVLQYRFNEGSGTTAHDSVGYGHMGVLTGNTCWTNGASGTKAVSFPSNDGGWVAPGIVTNLVLNQIGDWTIAFWVNNNSFPGAANYAVSTAPSTGIYFSGNTHNWGFSDGTHNLTSPALSSQRWYFVTVSKSAGRNYQLYVNGYARTNGVLNNVNINYTVLGAQGLNWLGMNGRMEDFRIYNRALTTNEVSTLSANGPNAINSTAPSLVMPPSNLQVFPSGQ